MFTLMIISLVFLGLVFGSFGSVMFYRLWDWPTKETWKWFLVWRSECPKCHHQLHAKNLVPLFSWLFQWWKCEYCSTKISWFYPFLEMSTVCMFVWLFLLMWKYWMLNHPIWLKEWYMYMPFMLISAWLLWLMFLYDIKTYELHITATMFLAIMSLFFTLFFGVNKLQMLLWIWIFTVIFLFMYFLWSLYVKQKYKKNSEWFWLWDVIMAPILWARLTFFLKPTWMFQWCYLICFFIILSCVIWLLYYLIELLMKKFFMKNKKKTKKTPFKWVSLMPFLPSMIIGFVLEIMLRSPLINIL